MRVVAMLSLILMTLPALAAAQGKGSATPATPPGQPSTDSPSTHAKQGIGDGQLAIGEMAPDFELDASTGAPLKLSTLRGKWVLLVFGPRKESLFPLRTIESDVRKLGATLVGVCDEKAYHLVSYAQREHLAFVMLADVTDEISQMYGLYNAERRTTAPGFVIIDRKGVVKMALLGQSVPPEDILRLTQFAITGQ